MFARITKYRMKPDSVDAAKARLEELKPQIMALPGMVEFLNVMNADGNGYVVSVVESEEISNSNADKVNAIWANFGEMLAAPPEPGGYDVVTHERA